MLDCKYQRKKEYRILFSSKNNNQRKYNFAELDLNSWLDTPNTRLLIPRRFKERAIEFIAMLIYAIDMKIIWA